MKNFDSVYGPAIDETMNRVFGPEDSLVADNFATTKNIIAEITKTQRTLAGMAGVGMRVDPDPFTSSLLSMALVTALRDCICIECAGVSLDTAILSLSAVMTACLEIYKKQFEDGYADAEAALKANDPLATDPAVEV